MKILTMFCRRATDCCVYCGSKKRRYDTWGGFTCCPTDMTLHLDKGCTELKNFVNRKEAKVQRALGLFSGPKGF